MAIPIAGTKEAYPVWHTSSAGKPLMLLHALNGISPSVLHYALELETHGYRVYIPSLYGDPIQGEDAFGYDMALAATKFLKSDPRWDLSSPTDIGPILDDCRDMARWIARHEGSRDLIVMGNCLTGSFPIALLDVPEVKTAVLAQPATPIMKFHQVILRLPQSPQKARSLALPASDLERAFDALRDNPDKHIIGFHYRHDPLAPISKFDALHGMLAAHQLEGRFHAFVLAPEHSHYGSRRTKWVTEATTDQPRKMLTPHSTLINPESFCDRIWFRERLLEALVSAR